MPATLASVERGRLMPEMTEEERELTRQRLTRKLLIAVAVSLLLPLVGVGLIQLRNGWGAAAQRSTPFIFERREGETPVAPFAAQAPVITSKQGLTAPPMGSASGTD